MNRLSPRETEVLERLARGMTTGEVAKDMFITEQTVRAYVRQIPLRLGATHRAHAVGIGYQRGILRVEAA